MNNTVAAKIEAFFSSHRVRTYEKGQILLMNGDQVRDVYYIVSGKVKMYDVTYRGEEIILNVFKQPAFFPMSLVLNSELENRYIYEAETDVVIRQASATEIIEFLKKEPDVALDLLRRVYSGLDGMLARMAYLMSGSAKSRLLYELLVEVKRFGTLQKDGSCSLTINEKDLGARAGLSRETVSREVHKLKKDDLLAIQKNDILIRDVKKLELLLGKEI